MADKFFLRQVQIKLRENATLVAALAKNKSGLAFISPSPGFQSVGDKYPQITLKLSEGRSEPKIPAGRYFLSVTIWVKKDTRRPFAVMNDIKKLVNSVLNREGDFFNDTDNNLRVALVLKNDGEIGGEKKKKLHFLNLIYNVVISEDESFDAADAGDQPWV